jgi:hypothetical protein
MEGRTLFVNAVAMAGELGVISALGGATEDIVSFLDSAEGGSMVGSLIWGEV